MSPKEILIYRWAKLYKEVSPLLSRGKNSDWTMTQSLLSISSPPGQANHLGAFSPAAFSSWFHSSPPFLVFAVLEHMDK